MKARSRRCLAAVALLTFSLSCAPDTNPTAVEAPQASLLGGLLEPTVNGILACNVTEAHETTQVVGAAGGVIKVGKHSLAIPSGALAAPTTITATAPAGQRVEIRFKPHGLRFERPSALTMSYADCGLVRGSLLKIVYVDDSLNILEILTSVVDLLRRTVSAPIDHFSSYMLAD